jgi:5-methyltetrahydrofolate--homocysteine methyltransferase
MQRQEMSIPLLVGGATTSRAHTAVKVDPKYDGPVVWVKDASRSVPVASALLSPTQRPQLLADVTDDFDALRTRHASRHDRPMISLAAARENHPPIDWSDSVAPPPAQPGIHVFDDYDLGELRDYIDWQPFFNAWEMKGRFPDILNNPSTGEEARKLYDDAQRMLDSLIAERWIQARGVVGFFPANADGDDIVTFSDDTRTDVQVTIHTLRQQGEHREGVPHKALADFVAPRETGVRDHFGAFAVTAGLGMREKVMEFKTALDDYSAIMLEALADRLAEAFAERLHQRVRTELWGYAPDEQVSAEDLLRERYVGIRPAPGYPACPDHTGKQALWQLLDVDETAGIKLTESMAMWPGASVSGWYFTHPQAQYFAVGRLGRDQVEDFAARKGWSVSEAERWLSANLGYDPED